MSKNPNYTGNQIFNIPFDRESIISGVANGKFNFYSAESNFNSQNLRMNVANAANKALGNYIRPRNENNPAARLPNFIIEPLIKFNLKTEGPRRSSDKPKSNLKTEGPRRYSDKPKTEGPKTEGPIMGI